MFRMNEWSMGLISLFMDNNISLHIEVLLSGANIPYI